MTPHQLQIDIAKVMCTRFLGMRKPTPRHGLLVQFGDLDVLAEMEQRCLIAPSLKRDSYLPTIGTFALLGDESPLYQQAHDAFSRVVYALWNLFRSEGTEVDHEPHEFAVYVNKLFDTPATFDSIRLGLYLVRDFGLLGLYKMSDDQMDVVSFRVGESVIRMQDPEPWWQRRVVAARRTTSTVGVPAELLASVATEEDCDSDSFDQFEETDDSFWAFIHPLVVEAAKPRALAGHYADAIESTLKVIATIVRERTGLTTDGADLMHKAFSPKHPLLVWRDSIPATQESLQLGYMEIFAGTMTGVRNPKAHAIVDLPYKRFVHFVFLTSLLAYKLNEAVEASGDQNDEATEPQSL